MKNNFKTGLFGTGLDSYWNQFDGLKETLTSNLDSIAHKLDCNVINAGMVDNTERSLEAASLFAKENIDLVFLYIATYSLSSTILPLVQRLKCPLIILNLQPTAKIDYDHINNMGDRAKMTGYWLANCQACSVPEVANVMNRSGLKYDIISGHMEEEEAWTEINGWISAAKVRKSMMNNKLGIIGHYYGGMLDVYTDITLQSAVFGTQMEMIEICELKKFRDEVSESEIEEKITEFNKVFTVVPECSGDELIRAAKTSVAMGKIIEKHSLGSVAYYFECADDKQYEEIATSVIAGNTILTGKGIPVAGECEVKNAQAMKIMSEFGAGGSFSEFYAMDFDDNVILLGHDGPAHSVIAEGSVKLVPLPVYHGKPGKGLSIQMSVKHGPVTLLSVCEGTDGVFLLAAEGESVPGPVLNIGNTNSRYKFPMDIKEFINLWSKAGPSHHCAIGVGHIAGKIEKLAFLLNISFIKIS